MNGYFMFSPISPSHPLFLSLLFLCVSVTNPPSCVCLCACLHVCGKIFVWLYVMPGTTLGCPSALSNEAVCLTHSQSWLIGLISFNQLALWISGLFFPRLELQEDCHTHPAFAQEPGIWTPVFMVVLQTLQPPSHLPNSKWIFSPVLAFERMRQWRFREIWPSLLSWLTAVAELESFGFIFHYARQAAWAWMRGKSHPAIFCFFKGYLGKMCYLDM